MAEFGLQLKQVTLEQSKQKQKHSEGKTRDDLKAKKHFQTWNYEQRELQKEKQEQGGYQKQEGEESCRSAPECLLRHAPNEPAQRRDFPKSWRHFATGKCFFLFFSSVDPTNYTFASI
jgi:hypothetical protein